MAKTDNELGQEIRGDLVYAVELIDLMNGETERGDHAAAGETMDEVLDLLAGINKTVKRHIPAYYLK